jgi:D-methionine transport system ATP-binding protein
MRIELPGRYEDNVVPVGFLREQGLGVDVVGVDEAATAAEATATAAGAAGGVGPTSPLAKEGAK